MSSWTVFRNTHLQFHWLFPLVIGDRQYDAVLEGKPRNFKDKTQRALERLLWFWPRVIEARIWAAGETGRLQTPANYTTLDDLGLLLLDWVEKTCPDRNAKMFDLGCNCGRHIIFLAEKGYRDLAGVDAMRSAISFFRERAPDVFKNSEIHNDLFQRFLLRQRDRRFDLTYSHGATIELVHPSFDIVGEMCRVTRRHICLILIEKGAFTRDWIGQFSKHGFEISYAERPVKGREASLIVLERRDAA